MNEEFRKQHAMTVRAIADKADPITKKRLLDTHRPSRPIPSDVERIQQA